MAEILLTSEKFVKAVSGISDNVAGKYLLPAIREAQEMRLKSIIGENLLASLKAKVAQDGPRAGTIYKELLERIQYFLAYQSVSELCQLVQYKVGNLGVVKTSDENVTPVSGAEFVGAKEYYQGKADRYALELQMWVLEHRGQLPELSASSAYKIHANLSSAASCGIWLGGPRGKAYHHKCEE